MDSHLTHILSLIFPSSFLKNQTSKYASCEKEIFMTKYKAGRLLKIHSIKNIAFCLLIGAVPLMGWVGGFFTIFSWTSFWLFLGVLFGILWIKMLDSSQTLRKLLLIRGEAWALCKGDKIIDRSPSFPGDSLQSLESFVHLDSLPNVQIAISELIHKNTSFHMRLRANESDAIYTLDGEPLDGSVVLWLKNITNAAHQESLQMEILQKSETLLANLQATMNLLPMPIWHRDKHQKIDYCNRAYSTAVQALPQKVYEEDIEFIQPRFAKTLARKALNIGESQCSENVAIANGERRYFHIYEIPNLQNEGTLGVALDATELNTTRSEINRLKDAHDKILDYLSTAIAVYNAEGILQQYNQAYIKLHSFDEEFLRSQPRLDEVLEELRSRRQLPEHADFPAYKKQQLQQLKEQIAPQEDLMHLPDERTLRSFSAPHPMGGLLFMFEDLTDSLDLERKNKTLSDAHQATVDNLFEGVLVVGSDNRLRIFNPSFIRLWNFKHDDIQPNQHLAHIMEKLKDLFDYEEDWESYKAKLIENVTDRMPKTGQLKRKDGIVINFKYVPLPNGDHLLSYTDTTDTHHVQQALQERNEALETADQLKSACT